jgi:hypothetical protein
MVADGMRKSRDAAGQRLTAAEGCSRPEEMMLIEQVVGRENLRVALGLQWPRAVVELGSVPYERLRHRRLSPSAGTRKPAI